MPSNPFDVPLELGDVNWYPGAANTVATSTDLATAKQTLKAHELVGMVPWAYELEEDAVIAMMAEVRSTLVRNAAQVLDDVLLNADTTLTNNINHDGAALATSTVGKAHYLIGFDGLVHQPLVNNTAMGSDYNAAPAASMFNALRRKMGKYGLRPSELAFVTDIGTYIAVQAVESFQTVDKLGSHATLLTGQLGAIEGVPLIVSEQLSPADSDGKVTAAGNVADRGRLLLVNRTQWRKGVKRELLIETERGIQRRKNVMVVSMRIAFRGAHRQPALRHAHRAAVQREERRVGRKPLDGRVRRQWVERKKQGASAAHGRPLASAVSSRPISSRPISSRPISSRPISSRPSVLGGRLFVFLGIGAVGEDAYLPPLVECTTKSSRTSPMASSTSSSRSSIRS